MNEFETHIPWDFLGLLIVMGLIATTLVCCALLLKARRRARLTSAGKDYVRRPHGSHAQHN